MANSTKSIKKFRKRKRSKSANKKIVNFRREDAGNTQDTGLSVQEMDEMDSQLAESLVEPPSDTTCVVINNVIVPSQPVQTVQTIQSVQSVQSVQSTQPTQEPARPKKYRKISASKKKAPTDEWSSLVRRLEIAKNPNGATSTQEREHVVFHRTMQLVHKWHLDHGHFCPEPHICCPANCVYANAGSILNEMKADPSRYATEIRRLQHMLRTHQLDPNQYFCTGGYWHNEETCYGISMMDDKEQNVCPITGFSKLTIRATPSVIAHSRVPLKSENDTFTDLESAYSMSDVLCVNLFKDQQNGRRATAATDKKLRKKRTGIVIPTPTVDNNKSRYAAMLLDAIVVQNPNLSVFDDYLLQYENQTEIKNVIRACKTIVADVFPGKNRFAYEKKKLLGIAKDKIKNLRQILRERGRCVSAVELFETVYMFPNFRKPLLSYRNDGSEIRLILRNAVRICKWAHEADIAMSPMEVALASISTCETGYDAYNQIVVPKHPTLARPGFMIPLNQYRFHNVSIKDVSESTRKFKSIVTKLAETRGIRYISFQNSDLLKKTIYSLETWKQIKI